MEEYLPPALGMLIVYIRNGQKYFMLGTTGGGSKLRSVEQGEFDHVTWVTMTGDGPVVANLLLDGIHGEDVRTELGDGLCRVHYECARLQPFSVTVTTRANLESVAGKRDPKGKGGIKLRHVLNHS